MSTGPDAPARRPRIADWIREHRIVVFFVLVFSGRVVVVAAVRGGVGARAVLRVGPAHRRCRRHRHHRGQARLPRVGAPGCCGGGSAGVWWVVALGTPLVVLAVASAANVVVWGAPVPGPRAAAAVDASCSSRRCASSTPSTGRSARSPAGGAMRCPSCSPAGHRWPPRVVLAPIVALWHLPLVTSGKLALDRAPRYGRDHVLLHVAVQPHRRQRAAHPGLPRRPGHLQLRRARFHGRRRGSDGLARRCAVVSRWRSSWWSPTARRGARPRSPPSRGTGRVVALTVGW